MPKIFDAKGNDVTDDYVEVRELVEFSLFDYGKGRDAGAPVSYRNELLWHLTFPELQSYACKFGTGELPGLPTLWIWETGSNPYDGMMECKIVLLQMLGLGLRTREPLVVEAKEIMRLNGYPDANLFPLNFKKDPDGAKVEFVNAGYRGGRFEFETKPVIVRFSDLTKNSLHSCATDYDENASTRDMTLYWKPVDKRFSIFYHP